VRAAAHPQPTPHRRPRVAGSPVESPRESAPRSVLRPLPQRMDQPVDELDRLRRPARQQAQRPVRPQPGARHSCPPHARGAARQPVLRELHVERRTWRADRSPSGPADAGEFTVLPLTRSRPARSARSKAAEGAPSMPAARSTTDRSPVSSAAVTSSRLCVPASRRPAIAAKASSICSRPAVAQATHARLRVRKGSIDGSSSSAKRFPPVWLISCFMTAAGSAGVRLLISAMASATARPWTWHSGRPVELKR
jgi:hypothetical protein